ncbi:hypothetical protein ARMGADRAFT_311816 [Armillaria gallica]|uniref:Uncharacterized protein n=1 Tax=Armillaria gallica TaxID=47427 RepID=A0A2H3D910_ARMGA|nr:hypothetical protein ARMGADRAFT_311816 [Armillaria gallica]
MQAPMSVTCQQERAIFHYACQSGTLARFHTTAASTSYIVSHSQNDWAYGTRIRRHGMFEVAISLWIISGIVLDVRLYGGVVRLSTVACNLAATFQADILRDCLLLSNETSATRSLSKMSGDETSMDSKYYQGIHVNLNIAPHPAWASSFSPYPWGFSLALAQMRFDFHTQSNTRSHRSKEKMIFQRLRIKLVDTQ